jgi:hypothetical protein
MPRIARVVASAAPEWILVFVLGVVTAIYWTFVVATVALFVRRLARN